MLTLLLRAESLRVLYGLRVLLDIDKIEIFDNDRIGLVGANGAGKSTLLAVLHGEKQSDAGAVRRFAESAMIRQFGDPERADEADAAIQARLGAAAEPHEGISGGELERIRIAQALSSRAPLLFADEPTTNLDFEGLEQVGRALDGHRGALVLVSHDRALLDELCTAIWELEEGKLRTFPGNYTAYREQKARERAFQRFEYEQYRAEQARLRSAIVGVKENARGVSKAPKRMGNSEARLHKRGKGTSAKARLERAAGALKSRLDSLDAKERPPEDPQVKMALNRREGITSGAAVRVEGMRLAAGGRTLLKSAAFTLPTGKRTVLIGPNGCGKTTLLRAIRSGAEGVRISPGVTIGWFGQETLDTLDPSLSLLENVMLGSVLPPHEARALMARMGLTSRDMDKPAAILSGGERAKAALARLMSGGATLLLLDEPGNHLDLPTLEALEDMLAAYAGTLLLVTHDRRMIDRVAQRLLLFERGSLITREGNLTELEESRQKKEEPSGMLTEDILRMRMAALLGRMSAPRKGETREALEAEYEAMEEQLRGLRGGVR